MIIAAGLVIAFVLLLIFSNSGTRRCRWRQDRTRDQNGARYMRCAACGAETFTKDGKPPKVCLSDAPRV